MLSDDREARQQTIKRETKDEENKRFTHEHDNMKKHNAMSYIRQMNNLMCFYDRNKNEIYEKKNARHNAIHLEEIPACAQVLYLVNKTAG